jgi:hypothetical protein
MGCVSDLMRWSIMVGLCACVAGPLVETDDQETDTDTSPPVPVDVDEDGFADDVDCDDYNPEVFPGAPELWDFKDNDCDGRVDANGSYSGTGQVQVSLIYEGQLRSWTMECTGDLNRSLTQLSIRLMCPTNGLNDALATTVFGDEITIQEVDNVAGEGLWEGAVVIESTAGWDTPGEGRLVWTNWSTAVGEVSASTANLSLGGSWAFVFTSES